MNKTGLSDNYYCTGMAMNRTEHENIVLLDGASFVKAVLLVDLCPQGGEAQGFKTSSSPGEAPPENVIHW